MKLVADYASARDPRNCKRGTIERWACAGWLAARPSDPRPNMKTLLLAGVLIAAIHLTAFSQEQKPTRDASTNGVDKTTAKETGRDGHFIAYDNGIVLDTKTKLMWRRKIMDAL